MAREARMGHACFAWSIQQLLTDASAIPEAVNGLLQKYAAVPVRFHLRYFWLRRKTGRGGFALTIEV